jgi:cytochrome c biogenesis protein CcmG, thiol:disulfide interchange protein DsbE
MALKSVKLIFYPSMSSPKTERLLRLAIVLLTVTFVFVIASTLREKITTVGDFAPDFTIKADNGQTVTAASFGGKLLVLNFWATWCPPCVEETPSLSRFAAEMAPSGVVVLAISVDKDEKLYREFLARHRPAFLTARDPDAKINADFGTFKYPETYVINASGKVLRKFISDQPWDSEKMVGDIKSLL